MTFNAPACPGLLQRHRALSSRVGNTPLVRFDALAKGLSSNVSIHAKLEWHQIGGSVKARAAHGILGDAIVEVRVRYRPTHGEPSGDLRTIWPDALVRQVEAGLERGEEAWEATIRW